MGVVRKTGVIAMAISGLVITSQAPEFSQQYRQRLGGAVEELQTVTQHFDRDANRASLSRLEALRSMRQSSDTFSRNRSKSMEQTIGRYEKLRGQRRAMQQIPGFLRPLTVMSDPDEKIMQDAWETFQPAIPLTPSGFIWGGIGALLLGGFGSFFFRLVTRMFKRKPKAQKNRNVTSKDMRPILKASRRAQNL